MYAIGILIALAAAGYGGYLLWKRHQEYEAKSAEREMAMLVQMQAAMRNKAEDVGREDESPALQSRASFLSPNVAVGLADTPRSPVLKHRVFDGPERVVFYLLKLGLPEHEIFPRLLLADFIEMPGSSETRVDFLICTKEMSPVAAVMLDKGNMMGEMFEHMASLCRNVGLRVVRLHAKQLPSRQMLREIVLSGDQA